VCPVAMVRYRCFGLRGLSGMVILTKPALMSGLMTWSLNLVLLVRLASVSNSPIGLSCRHLSRI